MKVSTLYTIFIPVLIFGIISCSGDSQQTGQTNELEFTSRMIADSVSHVWANAPADVNGDDISDLLFINNNSTGGFLGYFEGQIEEGVWERIIIAEQPPMGGVFASGDLEAGDIDMDGDMDVLAVKHPGEWADADAEAEIYWYENDQGSWISHAIGSAPDAVKDLSILDFDGDGKPDLAILTFEDHTLSIYRQINKDSWNRVQFIDDNESLHEGMDAGDIDGDGDHDIVANGFVFVNPGGDLTASWSQQNIDSVWNNQEGDWSRNGTKIVVKDLNADGKNEVFICHSERAGYPLNMYENESGAWEVTTITEEIPACHTLQVFDFDNDEDMDVLAGINRGRAVNIDVDSFEISLFLNEGDAQNWTEKVIGTEGIYNGQAVDYDNDGDMDIIRYPDHEATVFYLLENQLISQ